MGDLDVGDPSGESVRRFKDRLEKEEGKVSSDGRVLDLGTPSMTDDLPLSRPTFHDSDGR